MLRSGLFLLFTILLTIGLRAQGGLNSFSNGADSALNARMQQRNQEALAKEGQYDANSTRFTYEKNFKFNNIVFSNPDTIPDNFHRASFYERSNYTIQNLGNAGTAQRSLFYQTPRTIGRTSGYNAFNNFYTRPDQIRYFDTRSPYTDIEAIFLGGGRAITNVLFTLNDSTQFNIGGSFNAIRSEKQLAFLTRGDRQVTSNDWNLFGFLRPKKLNKYLMLFNFRQFKHDVVEQGGVIAPELLPEGTLIDDREPTFFEGKDAFVYLNDANSYDKRGGFHIYQQYDLDSIFQLYHTFDYDEQIVRYFDEYDLDGFDQFIYTPGLNQDSSATIEEGSFFRSISNELGLKGRTRTFSYTAFYRNRIVNQDIFREEGNRADTEHYLGGTLRQQITPKIFLSASGEFLFDGNYLLSGDFSSDLFEANYSRVVRQPSYLESRYLGQQKSWDNGFSNEISDNITGSFNLDFGRFDFRPSIRFNRISNFIFFNENKEPEQANSDIVLLTPGLDLNFQLSPRIKLSNNVKYNSVAGGSASKYRLPEIMVLSQLAFKNEVFGGKMIIHTGIDVFFQSEYDPLAYDPLIQQFYLQNGFVSDSFVKADLFLNFKVGNFMILFKSGHINQPSRGGYFITSNYTGYQRSLDLGVRWMFFD